jgi:hypothetical protein
LKTVVAEAPAAWKRTNRPRCNIAFLRPPVTPTQVMSAIDAKPGIDFVKAGKGAVYMATELSALQKSGRRKLIGTPVYRELTIRTYGTCQKILALMEDVEREGGRSCRRSSWLADHDERLARGIEPAHRRRGVAGGSEADSASLVGRASAGTANRAVAMPSVPASSSSV